MQRGFGRTQHGLSLISILFFLVVIGGIVLLGMKVAPTVTEYMAVKKAIVLAKASGSTKRDIINAFDKQADVVYIESIAGKDLDIVTEDGELQVSFAYDKKIPLFGPVSLLIEYEGTTRPRGAAGAGAPAAQ